MWPTNGHTASVRIICGEDDAANSKNNGWTPQSEEEKGIFLCKYFECFFSANACLRVSGHPRQVKSLIHFTHTSLSWNTYIALSNRDIQAWWCYWFFNENTVLVNTIRFLCCTMFWRYRRGASSPQNTASQQIILYIHFFFKHTLRKSLPWCTKKTKKVWLL